jgi:5'-nucleotidase
VFPAGNLTRGDVLAMHPFASVSCKVEVRGSTIVAALNHGVGRTRREASAGFRRCPGVTFRVAASAPPGARVQDVRIGGVALIRRLYTLAITGACRRVAMEYSMFPDSRVLVGPAQGNCSSPALNR